MILSASLGAGGAGGLTGVLGGGEGGPCPGGGGAGALTLLSEDGERFLCRGWHDDGEGGRKPVLAVFSALEHPTPGFVDRLTHDYGLRGELDGRSAARPLALVRDHG